MRASNNLFAFLIVILSRRYSSFYLHFSGYWMLSWVLRMLFFSLSVFVCSSHDICTIRITLTHSVSISIAALVVDVLEYNGTQWNAIITVFTPVGTFWRISEAQAQSWTCICFTDENNDPLILCCAGRYEHGHERPSINVMNLVILFLVPTRHEGTEAPTSP
ncbi:hypothetical protein JAAARDRAFT_522504 [Jaapia argillacea MUCL 33604]|uniref:Uncharacterized protein n=1 Tax=Jaapia argillacea MUCL 33604 TaxID=933084 RepID=A0A067Q471_9AGAM|nr:hypothetical protein JAAARDRAFT_522504 [Jaapia argillacea MUCL 33604]